MHYSTCCNLFLFFQFLFQFNGLYDYKQRVHEVISLDDNVFVGTIPWEIGYLTNVKNLSISNNHLTGVILFTSFKYFPRYAIILISV